MCPNAKRKHLYFSTNMQSMQYFTNFVVESTVVGRLKFPEKRNFNCRVTKMTWITYHFNKFCAKILLKLTIIWYFKDKAFLEFFKNVWKN